MALLVAAGVIAAHHVGLQEGHMADRDSPEEILKVFQLFDEDETGQWPR